MVEQLLNCHSDNPFKVVVIAQSKIDEAIKADINKKCLECARKNSPDCIKCHVEFQHDDPTSETNSETVLEKVKVENAKSIILLADENSDFPDDRNVLIALAIKKALANKKARPNIIAELKNPERSKHLKNAGVDEIISENDYSAGLIAQSAIFSGIATVYSNLLQYNDTTNEIYFVVKYPANYIGKTFLALQQQLRKDALPNNPLLLLGIIDNSKKQDPFRLNPPRNTLLNEGDALIVMTYDFIDKIESTEVSNDCPSVAVMEAE